MMAWCQICVNAYVTAVHFPQRFDIITRTNTFIPSSPWARADIGTIWVGKTWLFFYVHICPVHYLSHDRSLKLAAFMWLSSIFNISFSKNSIFVFFDDFQIIFKLRPSSMTVPIKYNYSNTSWYPFELNVPISLKKCSNCDKFMQNFLSFHNQWKIWTASLHLILRL